MAEQQQPQPVFMVPTPAGAVQRPQAPSTIELVEDQAQVLVDTWGHTGEIVKGMIVSRADAERQGYDWDHAVMMGAIRPLTQAEARPESLPTTFSALHDGTEDLGLRRTMRFHAGLTDEVLETVTTEQGPPEPQQFAKPTIEYNGPNEPPARPVRVAGSAQEAEAAAQRETQVVATPGGPAFATPEERQRQQEQQQSGEPSANDQRLQRRGRRE